MTYHFVNLVSWKFFVDKKLNNTLLFCDSLSLKLLLLLICKKKVDQVSGVVSAKSIISQDSTCFLVSKNNNFMNSMKLPFWSSEDNIVLKENIINFVANFDNIVIGISSPKQDKLSFMISEIYPNKNIFCLGAALEADNSLEKLERYGLIWLGFLIKDPKRTFNKIKYTFNEFFSILLNKKSRETFYKLSRKFKKSSLNF